MTRLFVDRQEINPLPADLNSIDQVLKLVESNHLPPDMIVREIQIDGSPLIREDLNTVLPDKIQGLDRIEIFTSTVRDVAVESIAEAIQYLDRVEAATPVLTSSLRTLSESDAASGLKQFYEGMYCIYLLLNRLSQTFSLPLQKVAVRGGDAQVFCLKLASVLKEIIAAHEQKDFELIGDLLEYEITPLISSCREVFVAIRARAFSRG